MSNTVDSGVEPQRAEQYVTGYMIATVNGYPCGLYKNKKLAEEIAKEINGCLYYMGLIENNSVKLIYLGRYHNYQFVEGKLNEQ